MAAELSYSAEAAFAMLMFSLASSSLLLINKLCLHYFPIPAFLSTLQFVCASVTSIGLMGTGIVKPDSFEWRKVKPYLLYVGMFVATIYANMRALQHSNVETIIVFRACVPLIVCVLDWAFLGRQLPSLRSIFALLVVAGGCAGYVMTDRAFKLNGWGAYTWVSAYFVIISFEMAYGKHIVGPHLQFASMWGPTMYTNTISVPPMGVIGLLTGELSKLERSEVTAGSITLLTLSCIIGVAISYLGWKARSLVTATCYTVLGVANKMLTVLANAMVWDQRATPTGMFFLCVCLVGAAGYKQAPIAEEVPEGAKGGGKCKGRAPMYVLMLVGAGAAVGACVFTSGTPLPPSPVPASPVLPPPLMAVGTYAAGVGVGKHHASGHASGAKAHGTSGHASGAKAYGGASSATKREALSEHAHHKGSGGKGTGMGKAIGEHAHHKATGAPSSVPKRALREGPRRQEHNAGQKLGHGGAQASTAQAITKAKHAWKGPMKVPKQ